jgi:SRSO17 transposase
VVFATKPQPARQMIDEALEADLPVWWVTADEVHGAAPIHAVLACRGVGYVLAVVRDWQVFTGIGRQRVDAIAAVLSVRSWRRPTATTTSLDRQHHHQAAPAVAAGPQ